MPKERDDPVVNITFQLKGESAKRFLEYMKREHIDINSVAAKKLTLERLEEIEAQIAVAA